MRTSQAAAFLLAAITLAGCGIGGTSAAPAGTTSPNTAPSAAGSPSTTPSTTPSVSPSVSPSAPSATPTPKATKKAGFTGEIARIDAATRKRMRYSYRAGCPVPTSQLRHLRMSYWGSDHKQHTGEMVVAGAVAKDVVKVFRRLYEAKYPIHRMELVDAYKGSDFKSIDANNTSAFNCRRVEGSSNWSNHASGRAIDLNPCQNPYVYADGHSSHAKCRKYDNRDRHLAGMVHGGDVVDRAFRSIGWGWGGRWSGDRDYQHFSENGR